MIFADLKADGKQEIQELVVIFYFWLWLIKLQLRRHSGTLIFIDASDVSNDSFFM